MEQHSDPPPQYMPRVRAVILQGLAILGKPRGIPWGAEADEWLRELANRWQPDSADEGRE